MPPGLKAHLTGRQVQRAPILTFGPPACPRFAILDIARALGTFGEFLQFTFVGAFDFLPGAAGGMYPARRQRMPSVLLPSLN